MATVVTDPRPTDELVGIELDELHPHPDNVRSDVGDTTELALSIRAVGLLEPIIVTPAPEGYYIVAGHRRAAAAKEAGLDRVDCLVKALDDTKLALEVMLIENLQREDLSPLEEARAYRRLVDELGYTHRHLAERIGRNQSTVSRRISLLELPANAQKKLDAGGITVREAETLTKLDPKAIAEVLKASSDEDRRWKLRRHEEAAKQAAAAEARRKELEGQGTTVLDEWPEGAMALEEIVEELVFAKVLTEAEQESFEAAHETEPCHAILLGYQERALCTEPSRHGVQVAEDGAEPAELTDEQKAERAEAEATEAKRQEQLEERRGERAGFYRQLIDAKEPPANLLEYVALTLIREPYSFDEGFPGETALALLGWDGEEIQEPEGIDERIANDPKKAIRYILALLLERGEEAMVRDRRYLQSTLDRSFLTWLESLGYEPSDLERELVAPAESG